MKILLADDDMNKRERIIEFILSKYEVDINEKKSYQSTLKNILEKNYDLIILDMTMPTFDITIEENGGRVKVFAGKEIMRKMIRRKRKIPVIIMTQFERFGEDDVSFEELEEELKTCYSDIFIEIIYYHNGLSGWQDKLERYLDTILGKNK